MTVQLKKDRSADGLRGIAALTVVMSHFIQAFLPAFMHREIPSLYQPLDNPNLLERILTSPFFTVFYNGQFAVVIFFVLSGYVLTMPFFKYGDILALKGRLWARYIRLNIPIAAAVFLSFCVYRLGLYGNNSAADLSGSAWLHLFYQGPASFSLAWKEAAFRSILFGAGTFVPPLWSLKVEFIGSLYVLSFYILKPQKSLAIPLGIVLCLIVAFHKEDAVYYLGMFGGSLLNRYRLQKAWLIPAALLGLYFGAFQFENRAYDFWPYGTFISAWSGDKKNVYNTIGAILLTASVVNGCGRALFELRLVQFLGRISFSLYLLHFIILYSLACWLYAIWPQDAVHLVFVLTIYLGVSVLAATLFERLVDHKAIALARRFSDAVCGERNQTAKPLSTELL